MTQEQVKNLFIYNKKTGEFIWRTRNHWRKGKKYAGTSHSGGYITITYKGKHYYAHRLAWLYIHGELRKELVIDHINGVRNDNRIENLRMVTQKENARNSYLKRGVSNVYYIPKYKIWSGQIPTVDGVKMSIGRYRTKEDALFVYNKIRPLFLDDV